MLTHVVLLTWAPQDNFGDLRITGTTHLTFGRKLELFIHLSILWSRHKGTDPQENPRSNGKPFSRQRLNHL